MKRAWEKAGKLVLLLNLTWMMLFAGLSTASAASNPAAVLRIGWTTEPDSLSPFITYEDATTELFLLAYDPLVAIGDNYQPVPRLAKSWTLSKDKLTWTFHLRKDVKWQDGVPFTSADVKYTYDTLMKTKLGLYADFENDIKSVTTPDKYTVVMKTVLPKANMLQITTPILPKHIWEKVKTADLSKWPDSQPIGTGAYQLTSWKKGQYVTLVANKHYFLGKPKVNKIIYQLFANNATMAQALKVGEIDAAIGVNEDYYKKLSKTKGLNVVAAPDRGFTELAFNSWQSKQSKGNPLMLNTAIRHAIEYAVNKQSIIDVAYSGLGQPGSTIVPGNYQFWHWQPSASELRTYDPAKANQVLDAAGFKKKTADGVREDAQGHKLEFSLLVRSQSTEEVKDGSLIKDMLKKVGIKVDVQAVDDGTLNDHIYKGANFDMFIWGWNTDLDPTTILAVLSSHQIGNLSDSYYSNKQYDALLNQEQTAINPKARQAIVWNMQKIAYQELPYLILSYGNTVQAVRTDKFTGWAPIQGAYFFGFNNNNYLRVEPISAASSPAASSSGKSSTTVIVLVIAGIVVVLGAIVFIRRSRKKGDFDEQ